MLLASVRDGLVQLASPVARSTRLWGADVTMLLLHSESRSPMLTRRDWLRLSLAGAATILVPRRGFAQTVVARRLTVYKSPTCGCCSNWVKRMQSAGFMVDAH